MTMPHPTFFLLLLAAVLLGMSAAGGAGGSVEASVAASVEVGAAEVEEASPGREAVDGRRPSRWPRAAAEPSVRLAPTVAPPVPPPEA